MYTRESLSGLALRFFLLATTLLALAGGIAASIPRRPELIGSAAGLSVPPIFALSTFCLAIGSLALIRAEFAVAREKQPAFRRSLVAALASGTVFVTVQAYALGSFLAERRETPSARGLAMFVTIAAGLHVLHFLVAWLFLVFITLQAHADRYDHEYHWGVTVCAWFWHALGIVWLAVLAAFLIAGWGFVEDGSMPDLNVG
jgi:cytochrome c oxidase subunit 3